MTDDGGAAAINTSSSQMLNVSREEIITRQKVKEEKMQREGEKGPGGVG